MKGGIFRRLAPLAPALLFLSLALPKLQYPGLHIDEGANGISASYVLAEPPVDRTLPPDDFAILFGRVWPIQSEFIVGAVMQYVLAPFIRLLGPGPLAMRLPVVLLSALTLLLLFKLLEAVFNARTAFWTSLLLACDVSFVQQGRLYHREEILCLFFLILAAFLSQRFLASGRPAFLCAGSFALGLGASLKLTFWWHAGALFAAAVLSRRLRSLMGRRNVALAFLSFCAGSGSLILYNLRNGLPTVRLLLDCLLDPRATKTGVDNLRYLPNLAARAGQLMDLLGGYAGERREWGVLESGLLEPLAPATGFLLALALAAAPILALRGHLEPYRRKVLSIYLFYLLVFLQTPFTISSLDPIHLLMIYPLPHLALGLIVDRLLPRAGALAPAFLILVNAHTNLHFRSEMVRTGGYGRWSVAVEELAGYLAERRIPAPVTFGFALRENVAFLTRRAVVPIVCEAESEQSLAEAYRLQAAKGPVHLIYAGSEYESRERMKRLIVVARRDGRKESVEKVFYNRAGDAVYWLYRLY